MEIKVPVFISFLMYYLPNLTRETYKYHSINVIILLLCKDNEKQQGMWSQLLVEYLYGEVGPSCKPD